MMLADRVKSSNKEKINCRAYFQDATSVGIFQSKKELKDHKDAIHRITNPKIIGPRVDSL